MRWSALACAAVLAAAAHAAEDAAVSVAVNPVRVSEHVWYVESLPGPAAPENEGHIANAGFVVTREGVVVFDALGSPPLARELLRRIRAITDQPVLRVIVSHYPADHIYGLQVFKAAGAEIWAHRAGSAYLGSDEARDRLEQRRQILFPWIDESTRLVPPDRWLDGDVDFELGGVRFLVRHVGPAHTAEDLALMVRPDGVLFAGDLVFRGRVPFVGTADSKAWLASLERLLALEPKVLVPGHGPASDAPADELGLTRDYLAYLRRTMGAAAADFVPFEEAYAATSWRRFEHLPAFKDANRLNAYNTYLLMEREQLAR